MVDWNWDWNGDTADDCCTLSWSLLEGSWACCLLLTEEPDDVGLVGLTFFSSDTGDFGVGKLLGGLKSLDLSELEAFATSFCELGDVFSNNLVIRFDCKDLDVPDKFNWVADDELLVGDELDDVFLNCLSSFNVCFDFSVGLKTVTFDKSDLGDELFWVGDTMTGVPFVGEQQAEVTGEGFTAYCNCRAAENMAIGGGELECPLIGYWFNSSSSLSMDAARSSCFFAKLLTTDSIWPPELFDLFCLDFPSTGEDFELEGCFSNLLSLLLLLPDSLHPAPELLGDFNGISLVSVLRFGAFEGVLLRLFLWPIESI